MASSRLEKIGTIYTRLTGLLRAGALKAEDTPVWYNVYKAFPPQYEPKYDRPAPNIPVKNIFYLEDEDRAWFHKQNKQLGTVNMADFNLQTPSQKFVTLCNKLREEGHASSAQLYERALEMLTAEGILQQERQTMMREVSHSLEKSSIASSFQEANRKKTSRDPSSSVNIKDIFKD